MIKILYNEKKIYLTEDYRECIQKFKLTNALIVFDPDYGKLMRHLDILLISEIDQIILYGNVGELLQKIRKQFLHVMAAGGLVTNLNNEYLFIFRRGKWDLPKGKMEPGELIEQCAIREVMEETGLKSLYLLAPHAITYHFYFENEMVFKETHWYLMQSEDKALKPQVIEGITKATWVPRDKIGGALKNTYESIRDLFSLMQP